jgi:hypothetical protein
MIRLDDGKESANDSDEAGSNQQKLKRIGTRKNSHDYEPIEDIRQD